MTTVINGANIVYGSDDITNALSETIYRNGFNSSSTDTFPSTDSLILSQFGVVVDPVSMSFEITIVNDGAFNINQKTGTSQRFIPTQGFELNQDIILPGQAKTYLFTITSGTEADIVINAISTGPELTGIILGAGQLIVGDSNGVAQNITMGGEGNMNESGSFTLGSTIANATTFINNLTSNATIQGLSLTDGTATLNNGFLSGLVPPLQNNDAANKQYVDNLVAGLSWKEYVRSTTVTEEIALTGIPSTLGGVTTLHANDRVLLTNQTSQVQNGIWLVKEGAWARPLDFPEDGNPVAASMFVSEGNSQNTAWVCNTPGPAVIDTTPITFVSFNSGGIGITSLNGETGTAQTLVVGSSPAPDFQILNTPNSNTTTFNLPDAGIDMRGVVTYTDQTLAGIKTFDKTLIANTSLQLKGDTEAITFSAPAATSAYPIIYPATQGLEDQVLTNDGLGALDWKTPVIGTLSYYYAYGPVNAVDVLGTFNTVVLVEKLVDGAYTSSEGLVTVADAGIYKLTYTAQFRTKDQGGAKSSFGASILLNDVTVEGSTCTCYARKSNGNVRPGCGKSIILAIDASGTVQLQVGRVAGTTTGNLQVNSSNLIIERLK